MYPCYFQRGEAVLTIVGKLSRTSLLKFEEQEISQMSPWNQRVSNDYFFCADQKFRGKNKQGTRRAYGSTSVQGFLGVGERSNSGKIKRR